MALGWKKGGYPVFDLVAPAGGFTAYKPVKIGDLMVIPQTTTKAGEKAACHIPGVEAEFDGAVAAIAITVANGHLKKIYHVNSGAPAGKYSTEDTNATFIGYGMLSANVAADGTFRILTMGPGA